MDSLAALIPPPDISSSESSSKALSINSDSRPASADLGQGLGPGLGQGFGDKEALVSSIKLDDGGNDGNSADSDGAAGGVDTESPPPSHLPSATPSPSRPTLTRSRSVRMMGVGSPTKQPKSGPAQGQGLGQGQELGPGQGPPLGGGYGSPLFSGEWGLEGTEALTDYLQAAVGGEIGNMEVLYPLSLTSPPPNCTFCQRHSVCRFILPFTSPFLTLFILFYPP